MEKRIDVTSRLEEALLKLDYVEGTLQIVGTAFEHSNAFASMNPEAVMNTLSGLHANVKSIQTELNTVLESLMINRTNYESSTEDISEIISQMHEVAHEDDSIDIYFSEIQHFYNQMLDAVSKDKIIDAIWDVYLFGVYRGQHGADQEG